MIKQYWKIECSKHLHPLFKAKVSTKLLSEKQLKNFIRTLIAKYILTPEEVLEEYKYVPFKKRKEHVPIIRTNDNHSGKIKINYMADGAGVSIIAYLIEEFE